MQEARKHSLKFDADKLRMDLIPNEAIRELAKVMSYGAKKYGDHNWLNGGLNWSQLIAAAKRHLNAFERGIDFDEEALVNGERLYHAAQVAANMMMLVEYYKVNPHKDDRVHGYLRKPRIVLDIDEVIADFIGAYEKRYNVKLNNYWNSSYQIKDNLKELQNDRDFWLSIPKLRDVPFEPLAYVSSRSIPQEWVEEWLQNNGFPCAPVHLVPWNESKVEKLQALGNDIIFVDDKFENFRECNNAGICTYLMDAPHNQHYEVGYKRIYNLDQLK